MNRSKTAAVRMFVSIFFLASVLIPSFSYCSTSGGQGSRVFEFDLGGGWGTYAMSSLSDDYIGKVAVPMDVFGEKIENGPGFSFYGGYFVLPNLSIGLGYSYLAGATDHKGEWTYLDLYGETQTIALSSDLKTSLHAPELRARYYFTAEKAAVFLGGSIAWCYGRASLDVDFEGIDGEAYDYSGHGLGAGGSVGLVYEISRPFSFFVETGYRYYKTGTLKDDDGEEWTLDILTEGGSSGPGVDLDFGGFFVTGGFSLSIWR